MSEETEVVCAFKGDTETLRPSEIRFTREFIAPEFRDGIVISNAVDEILAGRLPVEVFEPLKVFKHDGRWHTWYNQRLFLFRCLELQNFVDFVIVREVDEENGRGGKALNTNSDGLRIRFRYDDIPPHGPILLPSDGSEEDAKSEEGQLHDPSQEGEDDNGSQNIQDEDFHDAEEDSATKPPQRTEETTQTVSTQTDNGDQSSFSITDTFRSINRILDDLTDERRFLSFVSIVIMMHVALLWYFS